MANTTIMLIHGMFLNPRSWEPWQRYFQGKGYDCIAPAWPLHAGEPAALRSNPPARWGRLSLDSVIETMRGAAAPYDDLILIGHSVSGLIVQKLLSQGIG
jgi:pimeloyl-ACP methyl ester carboxylesterase